MTETEAERIIQEIRSETEKNACELPEVDFLSCLRRPGGVLETDLPYCAEEYEHFLYVQRQIWDNQIEISDQSPKSPVHFVGRCIKKVIKLVLNPWIASQNEFNANLVNTNFQLWHYIQEKEKECIGLRRRIEKLEDKLEHLESR